MQVKGHRPNPASRIRDKMRAVLGLKQSHFNFLDEIDEQVRKEKEREREYSKRRNADYHLKHCLKEYPITDYERKVIPEGVRASRHVNHLECERCEFDCYDHTLGGRFGRYRDHGNMCVVKICLKDMVLKGHVQRAEIMGDDG